MANESNLNFALPFDGATVTIVAAALQASAAASHGWNVVSSAGGTVQLTQEQSRAAVIEVAGTLTSDLLVLLHQQGKSRRIIVENGTTGAFAVEVGVNDGSGVAAGDTVEVSQGYRRDLIHDGTDVLDAADDPAAAGGGVGGGGGIADYAYSALSGISGLAARVTDKFRGLYYKTKVGVWVSLLGRANILDFYASAETATTTTTGTNSAAATTINVTSSATYSANQGILIAGAGAAGADYIGTVQSVPSGTSIQVTPAISTTVSAGTLVMHDNTAAILAALDAVAGSGQAGGEVYGPAGRFYANGNLDATHGAIITFPQRGATAAPVTIRIRGEFVEKTSGQTPQYNGFVIDATRRAAAVNAVTDAAVFAAKATSATSTQSNFNYIALEFENVHIKLAPNGYIGGINAHNATNLLGNNLQISNGETAAGFTMTQPTTGKSFGVISPGVNNHAQCSLMNGGIYGLDVGVRVNEHLKLWNFYCSLNKIGLDVEEGGHFITGNVGLEYNRRSIRVNGALNVVFQLTVSAEFDHGSGAWMDSQTAGVNDFDDAGNVAKGYIFLEATYPSGGTQAPRKSGFGNAVVVDMVPGVIRGDQYVKHSNANGQGSFWGMADADGDTRHHLQGARDGATGNYKLFLLANAAAHYFGGAWGWTVYNTALKKLGIELDPSAGEINFLGGATGAGFTPETLLTLKHGQGVKVAVRSADPTSPANGEVWYNSTANELRARINGATVALGAGGGGGTAHTETSAHVYNSANQSIPTGAWTTLTFDSEDHDSSAFHSTASNTSRLTIPATGKYYVAGVLPMGDGPVNVISIRYLLNGAVVSVLAQLPPTGSTFNSVVPFFVPVKSYTAGDYLEFQVYHDAAGAANAGDVGNSYFTRVSIVKTA